MVFYLAACLVDPCYLLEVFRNESLLAKYLIVKVILISESVISWIRINSTKTCLKWSFLPGCHEFISKNLYYCTYPSLNMVLSVRLCFLLLIMITLDVWHTFTLFRCVIYIRLLSISDEYNIGWPSDNTIIESLKRFLQLTVTFPKCNVTKITSSKI